MHNALDAISEAGHLPENPDDLMLMEMSYHDIERQRKEKEKRDGVIAEVFFGISNEARKEVRDVLTKHGYTELAELLNDIDE